MNKCIFIFFYIYIYQTVGVPGCAHFPHKRAILKSCAALAEVSEETMRKAERVREAMVDQKTGPDPW